MTIDEIIEGLKDICCGDCYGWGDCANPKNCEYYNLTNIAIELLEKQTPKRPIYEADGYSDGELVYDTWYCPNCDKSYEVDYDRYDYCPNCGQKIDWVR